MTRKDYQLIAGVFKTMVAEQDDSEKGRVVTKLLAYRLADAFKRDNERFDYAKFVFACDAIKQ